MRSWGIKWAYWFEKRQKNDEMADFLAISSRSIPFLRALKEAPPHLPHSLQTKRKQTFMQATTRLKRPHQEEIW
jgi:hypothetical protein